jgi:hypothetical protein
MRTTITTVLFTSAAFLLNGVLAAQTFTSHPISFAGTSSILVTGINASNQMVLNYTDSAATNHCLMISGKTVTHIADPNEVGTGSGKGTSCYGINNAGQVVGTYSAAAFGNGFVLSEGVYTDIIIPTATAGTSAYALNNVGQVAGSYADNVGQHGFLYTVSSGDWEQLDVPGASATLASGLNDAGIITFEWVNSSFVASGALLYEGKYHTLNVPGASQSVAHGVNVHNFIVMEGQDSSGNWHGYLYKGGQFTEFNVANATSTHSFGLSDNDVIVGGYNPASAPSTEIGFYGYF